MWNNYRPAIAASLNEATVLPSSAKKCIWCSAAQTSKKVEWYVPGDNTCCKKLCNSICAEQRETFSDITVTTSYNPITVASYSQVQGSWKYVWRAQKNVICLSDSTPPPVTLLQHIQLLHIISQPTSAKTEDMQTYLYLCMLPSSTHQPVSCTCLKVTDRHWYLWNGRKAPFLRRLSPSSFSVKLKMYFSLKFPVAKAMHRLIKWTQMFFCGQFSTCLLYLVYLEPPEKCFIPIWIVLENGFVRWSLSRRTYKGQEISDWLHCLESFDTIWNRQRNCSVSLTVSVVQKMVSYLCSELFRGRVGEMPNMTFPTGRRILILGGISCSRL